jgi:hypothetical protein
MDEANFPIEFNNEIDDVKKSENEFYTLAVDRLSKLAEGHNDISGGVVNLKQPAQGHQTSYIYEVTIVVYMGSYRSYRKRRAVSIHTEWRFRCC